MAETETTDGTETTDDGFGLETRSLTGAHWAAIGLAAITGIIHLYLFWTQDFVPFLLAGLGFFGAIALVLVGFHRRLVYLVGVPYTLAQMAGWVMAGTPDFWLGVFDKIVQVALIGLLVYLYRRETTSSREAGTDVTA